LPDGSRVRRESHARFCERLAVKLRRPTHPHFCTRSRKYGSFVIGRKTIKKRMRATLQAIKMELRKRLHDPIAKTGAWVYSVLKGHLNYFAVSGNDPSLWWFFNQVKWHWLRGSGGAASGPTSTGQQPSKRVFQPNRSDPVVRWVANNGAH
jgi:hypothetical protein